MSAKLAIIFDLTIPHGKILYIWVAGISNHPAIFMGISDIEYEKLLWEKSGIYMWTSPSGKKYVGQAKNLKTRYLKFFSLNKHYTTRKGWRLTAIDMAREKYPDFSQWKYEVLEYCSSDLLDEREEYYIKLYHSSDSKYGYNLTKGGQGTKGVIPRSAYKKGHKKTEEEVRKCNITRKIHEELGLIDYGKGKRVSPMKGKNLPKETKEKISNTLKGNIPWNKGKRGIYSEECRESNKKKHKPTPVLQFTLSGEFIRRWDYMSDAAKELGICKNNILSCIRHYRGTQQAGGYKWEYAS